MNQEVIKALADAKKKENEAYENYCKLIKRAENPNQETLFRELALQELKHEALLEEYERCYDFLEAKERMERRRIEENFQVVGKLSVSVSTKGLIEALEKAIALEKTMAALYRYLQTRATSAGAKDLFHYLSKEEDNHERLIRKELQNYLAMNR